ncbi:MAG: response regulator transcription factor, partial [Actinobacteria bacterium]|nr:response regulator transcription factor [Actinomycetota bacterium]
MAPMTQSTAPLPRVLIVDDEAPLAGVIASYFERDGFETTIVGDGEAAIAKVREWNPGVVVLDLGLPGVDGLQVCRTVRT